MASAFCRNEGESFDYCGPVPHTLDQLLQAQQARDAKILELVRAMENTYSFVVSADELKRHPVLQDIMDEILKQTIECGYFIQAYARRNFGGMWYAL